MSYLPESSFKGLDLNFQTVNVVSVSSCICLSILGIEQFNFLSGVGVLYYQLVKGHLSVHIIAVLLRFDVVEASRQVRFIIILLITNLLPYMLEEDLP